MCAYFSKSEYETSEAMKQAAKDACNMNKNNFVQMKSIVYSKGVRYYNHRQKLMAKRQKLWENSIS